MRRKKAPEKTEDGDSGDKPVAGPEAAAAFWKRTDHNLAKMFSTCINKWSFLGLGLGDPTFEITADAEDLSLIYGAITVPRVVGWLTCEGGKGDGTVYYGIGL
jgi:hypothetical protein